MWQVDRNIERLIFRRLDGELTEEERLELDRALLRSPEARRLLEEHERIDTAAAAALETVVADCGQAGLALVTAEAGRQRSYRRSWWALPAAVAAAVALVTVVIPQRPQGPEIVVRPPDQTNTSTLAEPQIVPEQAPYTGLLQAAHQPGEIDRAIDRDSLYIVGDDGRIYVIDQQRVRTTRQPNRDSAIRQVSGDL